MTPEQQQEVDRREVMDKLYVFEAAGRNPLSAMGSIARQQCVDFLVDQLTALRTSLAEAQALTEWRDIASAPKDENVLVSTENGTGEARCYSDHRDEWRWAGNDPTDSWGTECLPTHWQPLPPRAQRAKESA